MVKQNFLKIIALIIFLASCQEDEARGDEMEFVPGEIFVGIKSEISIDKVFEVMNENQLTIDQMSGFFTYSLLPIDSLDFINNQLASKPYLNRSGWDNQAGYVANGSILLTTLFFGMDKPSQADWMETIQVCKLVDLQTETKNLLIKVVPGTEERWLKFFESHPYVTWTHLNEYVQIRHN